MALGLAIDGVDRPDDLSIYDQGAYDWSMRSWIDFQWGPGGSCPDQYEPIGNMWLGTVEGNTTDSGVDKTYA